MADEKWQKAKEIFVSALQQKPTERRKFLDDACDDAEIRREVESLLDSFDNAGSFMQMPAIDEFAEIVAGNSKKIGNAERFAHYEIIEQIGVGGMGEVYLAKDTRLDRRVAIKILNEQFSRHESNLQRFIQEAKAASALNHPNILVIHEIGEAENSNYIVSEFIEGKTLRETMGETRLRKPSEILDIAIQIANALTAAHEAHIIHRDIKPENIMLRPDGYVKILDFGLAKLIEPKIVGLEDAAAKQNQTAKGIILGTINYMSPEQAKGEKVDERTDIFSFGTLVYEMIAGRTPFAADSMSETFANLINAEPPPLSRFSSNVPDELQHIVSKTLRKNRDERYQTMKELCAELKKLRENLAFDERLEKANSSNNKAVTAVLPAATGDMLRQTAETKNNFTGQNSRRKTWLVFVFAIFLIAAIGFGYYFRTAKNTASGSKKTLAVLPFLNAGQDPDAEYLADGITESIINNLSQLSGLKVMSRNSVFRFKNNQTDTKNIASQLGVESFVTGDIKQLGDKLIINVRLIDARDDSQIWGSQYVKNSGDIIAIQKEIAQAVANNLRLKLTNVEQQQLRKNYTENARAYELYLRGRYHYFKLNRQEIGKSIDFYRQAIDNDPTYALASAGIADAYRTLPIAYGAASKEAFPKAREAAQKALEIDPDLAEAHIVLGWVELLFDWDWQAAETELKKTLDLAPNNPEAHRAYAQFLSIMGRHDEAVSEGKRARELDPLSLLNNALEGQFLFYAGRYDEALERLNKTIEMEPDFWIAHNAFGRVYLLQGRFEEAAAAFAKAQKFSNGSPEPVMNLGYVSAKYGSPGQARAALKELRSLAPENYVPAYDFAMVYNGLGETDEALNYLQKSFEEREVQLTFIKIDTRWDNLRGDPRFIDLIKRMNSE